MPTIPQRDSETALSKDTTKSVRITAEVWESVSHEAIDRCTNRIAVIETAWAYFMSLPESRREKLVRSLDARERVA